MKFIEKDPRQEGAKNIIALTGHNADFVPIMDKEKVKEMEEVPLVSLPVYKNTPRAQYQNKKALDWEQDYIYEVHPRDIKDLPKPISGLSYVVSRETLRIITRQNELIEQKEKYNTWLRQVKGILAIVAEQELAGAKTLAKNLAQEIEQELKETQEKIFLDKPRKDFLAPGSQLKKNDKNGIQRTLACCGLISAVY